MSDLLVILIGLIVFALIGLIIGEVLGRLIYRFVYWSLKGQERREDYSMCLDCRDGQPQWCASFPEETCFEKVQRLKREATTEGDAR